MGLSPSLWSGKRVLVTGHTGFKGSWLTLLLKDLGAEVVGLSLPPEGSQSLYTDARIREEVLSEFFLDIRDLSAIKEVLHASRIDYVFHLAAQAFVRRSVKNPIESVTTNILGTANVLIASLQSKGVLGTTIVTTDKVYENLGADVTFKESDKLGGLDPYSASKAAAELIVASIISSNNPNEIPVTTVRAGNVIGGGDWGEDRLVPDIVRTLNSQIPLLIRNPNATRPWQHVLECLYGYLLVAESHLREKSVTPSSINFGPNESLSVMQLLSLFEESFGRKINYEQRESSIPESKYLALDSSLAHTYLGWFAELSPIQAVSQTAEWYSNFEQGSDAKELVRQEISIYKVGKW